MYQPRHATNHGPATPSVPGIGRPGRRTLLRSAGGVILGGGILTATATSAQAATSQNGWLAGTSSQIPLVGLTVDGVSFPAGVRSGDVATVLGYVARRFDGEVESLVAGWCWGHAYRPIRGGTTLSNHASGTAIDLNAPRHSLGSSGTFSASQRAALRSILDACAGVVRWGGDYSGRKDEMHVEINVRPGDSRLPALAQRIRGGTPPPPPAGWTTVRRGSTGFRVVALQYLLRQHGQSVTTDGVFGAVTESRVVAFQRSRGLAADGVVGPLTWAAVVVQVREGSRGEAVKGAQSALRARGQSVTVDGIFGPVTAARARAFQSGAHLTADGIVGPKTWAALTH